MFAFMEAADESKRQGGAPVSIESVLEQARVASTWKGTWDGGDPHRGELRCLVRRLSGLNWEATFTGYCNRQFAYEVKMTGEKKGDKVIFSGQADLGDADGGLYQWTGEIYGETFLGHYASEQGKTGTFTMQRAVVTSGESG